MSRRLRGDRGAAMVAALVLMFSMTSLAVIWLARDVDRSLSNRASARAIAFQAARSGAQQIDVAAARSGSTPGTGVPIDAARARDAAHGTADRLFGAYGVDGTVSVVSVAGDRVTVTVEIRDTGVVSATASARAIETP